MIKGGERMIKGLYTSSSSMITNEERLNIISNNLANISTNGYKVDEGIQRSFPEVLISRLEGRRKPTSLGKIGTGVSMAGSYTDFKQGSLVQTGGKLDLALEGRGFFVVQTPSGLRYTRDGNFTLNNRGQIVTQQGYPVLGERGPLQTIEGRDIIVSSDGRLHLGNVRGDRLLIVDFPDQNSLEKVGNNLYLSEAEGEPAREYSIMQGFLENSNVNVIQEMVKMIQVNRYYEANQKVITIMDSTLDKAVNSVGTVR